MTTLLAICGWLLLSMPSAVLLGRGIHYADTQQGSERRVRP